ncbi:unnamed protein product [Mytilus edulis]|uniref:Uncharacterized protein n=1 Tax=Mytilus edulis TaxID=6550 RepID=A0A8S3Q8C7_MYTED|nr:unnamed protein product [Mytilus edulis]
MYESGFTGTITVETENTFYQCMKVVHWHYNSRETENAFYQCMKVVHWYYNSRDRKNAFYQCESGFTGTITVETEIPSATYESGSLSTITYQENTFYQRMKVVHWYYNSRDRKYLHQCMKVVHWYYNSRETENTFYQCMKVVHWYYNSETENTFYQRMKVVHWYYNSREKVFRKCLSVERQNMHQCV